MEFFYGFPKEKKDGIFHLWVGGWVKGFSIKKNAQNELNSNELKIILKATYFFPFLGGVSWDLRWVI